MGQRHGKSHAVGAGDFGLEPRLAGNGAGDAVAQFAQGAGRADAGTRGGRLGPQGGAAPGQRHGLDGRQPRPRRIGAGPRDIAQNVEGPILDHLDGDLRPVDHAAPGSERLGNVLRQFGRGKARGGHRTRDRHRDRAVGLYHVFSVDQRPGLIGAGGVVPDDGPQVQAVIGAKSVFGRQGGHGAGHKDGHGDEYRNEMFQANNSQ